MQHGDRVRVISKFRMDYYNLFGFVNDTSYVESKACVDVEMKDNSIASVWFLIEELMLCDSKLKYWLRN